jgi:hypothetical protein
MNNNFESFLVPDGTLYTTLNGQTNYPQLKETALEFLGEFSKVKLIVPSFESETTLKADLESTFAFKVHPTTFFSLNLNKVPDILNWEEFASEYTILEVGDDNFYFFTDFIITSYDKEKNGVDWETVVSQENLKNYLVQENESGKFVGSFSIGATEKTLQLQSVAGRSQRSDFITAKRLPILTVASVKVALDMQQLDKEFIFSSSKKKLVEAYEDLGFEQTSKYQTWVLEKIV